MRSTRLGAAVAVAASLALVPLAQGSPSEGSDPDARAKFVSKIDIQKGGKKATLKVRYRCNGGESLWVSAKQTASGERDAELKEEGSSEVAAAWLQSHRNKFECDGKRHEARFTIDKVEDGSKGKLVKGEAWVQFCVVDGRDLILSKTGWVEAR
ncbi:MAG TPA: hypothetical protein VHF58_06090 [Solirubrobacterales bacterium]|nr:hypothetical protein [Solirubrobacterales bacterium]